ncbi:nucleotide exchange factor GrpE [Ilyobacter polytropus]|uniref:Protein GrpE n=1 Tax=Ilyobacter polytropus (strain ATCC 51220 / DSM 2926 / LMG 16218 / CuHBu1) TaxID=572544 RepID=E3HA44_ILYPC|nr:nucleotide exchange factor GrpE [Ilyobacter polytropus]ADO83449.1 GrpE protein [Ilyobacter polytropus DSM 2926]
MAEKMKKKSDEILDELEKEGKKEANSKDEKIMDAEEVNGEAETLTDKIDKIEAEVEEWKQAYLRKQADFQNFTKRKEKEAEELRKYASEKVMSKVIEAVDNLERGVAASSETKDFDSLVKGVEMTLSQMHGIMNEEGVEAIKTEGQKFDPNLHMAVIAEDSPEHEDDDIILELQKGYKLKGKVIRPSMVKVCKK